MKRTGKCPVCGFGRADSGGRGESCKGFVSDDGSWAHCTRVESPRARKGEPPAWPHRVSGGRCDCGSAHDRLPQPKRQQREHRLGREVARYDYVDADGVKRFVVIRYEPKDFRQRDTAGNWHVKHLSPEHRALPYHLPMIREALAEGKRTIEIPEGEKDVHTLEREECVATCNAGGAGKWRVETTAHLVQACEAAGVAPESVTCRVWIDDDKDVGWKHAKAVRTSLLAAGFRVDLVKSRAGKDATDHIEAGFALGAAVSVDAAELDEKSETERCAVSRDEEDDARAHEPHLAPVPAYPVDDVPEPLRSLALAGERAGLPPEYVAAAGLAALAYTALDSRIVATAEWVEPPALWLAIVGPASTAKSPAMRYGAAGTVWHSEAALRAADERAIAAWRARPTKERGPRPARTTRVVGDITIEALVRRLAEAGPQMLEVDELRSWLGGLGRYGQGAAAQRDLGHVLAMWDAARPLTYDRVGGDTSIVAPEPAVSVIGTLQTEDHRLLGGVESGLRARWLPHLYRGAMPDRIDGHGEVPRVWTSRLTDLLQPRRRLRLQLAPAARILWYDAECRWQGAAEDASPGVRAAAAKAPKQALRVALVLALAMDAAPDVPADAMHAAVAVVDYALDVWRALPEGEELTLSYASERTSEAVDRLASWLERRPDLRATRDRILRSQVAGIRTAEILDAVLEHYQAVYPGSVVEGPSTSRGGRRGVVVHAPRRQNAKAIPRARGISGARAQQRRDAEREQTHRPPRDLPEESGAMFASETSALPEVSAVDSDSWERDAEVTP